MGETSGAQPDRTLRVLLPADAPLVVEATSGETAPALWGPRPAGPYSEADALAALTRGQLEASGGVTLGLIERERLVGGAGIQLDKADPQTAELAYWVRPERRGHGFGTLILRSSTAWAQAELGVTQPWLEIDPANLASQRVAERAGYVVRERIARHCRAWGDDDPARDDWHDCLIYVPANNPG